LKVWVKLVGKKVGRGEKDFSFTFHWPPSKEPSPSPSVCHQALDLPSHSFFFSFKGGLGSLELSYSPNIIFNSILRILVHASLLRRKKMINFGSGGKEGE
jgi:hypothetical protein